MWALAFHDTPQGKWGCVLCTCFIVPHRGLRRDFGPILGQKSVTLSVGSPLCFDGIAYRRAYILSTPGLFKKFLRGPLCGLVPARAPTSNLT